MTNQTKFNYVKRRIEELEHNIFLLNAMIQDNKKVNQDVVRKVIESMENEVAELVLLWDEDEEVK